MGARLIELPWDSQPQEAVEVNWDSPFTRDLVFAVNFAAGFAPRNIARGAQGVSTLTGTLTRTVQQLGAGISGSNGGLSLTDPTNALRITSGPVTHAGIVNLTGIDGNFGAVFAVSDTSSNVVASLQRNGTSGNMLFFRGNQGGVPITGAIAALLAGPCVFVVGSESELGTTGGFCFVNGVQLTTGASSSAGTQASGNVSFRPFLDRSSSTAFGSDGAYFEHFAWQRYLSLDEARWLSQSPANIRSAIYAPQQIFVPRAAAAPGLPTLSAITPSLITATGWRDTITAA
jgi:hypothetical protein